MEKGGAHEAVEVHRTAGHLCAPPSEVGFTSGRRLSAIGRGRSDVLCVEKEIRPSRRERTPPLAAGGRGKRPAQMIDGGPSRSTSTCCRRHSEKQAKARPPPGTRPVVPWDVFGELRAGLPIGAIQSRRLVSTESGHGSIRSPASHSGSGPCPTSVRLLPDLGLAQPRRLAREPEAGATLEGLQLRMRVRRRKHIPFIEGLLRHQWVPRSGGI